MSDYLAKPKSPRGGVMVLHAWWGLNDFFKHLCDKLADEGYIALAPDLYNGKVATTIVNAEKLRNTVKREEASTHVSNALKELKLKVEEKPIGGIGFSMGANGLLSLIEERPKDFSAAVLFYGTRGGEYAKVKTSFLGHFAESDEYVSDSGKRKLEKTLKAVGKDVAFFTYPNTHHWFFENDRPEYNLQAAELAWQRTVKFLGSRLG